MSQTTRVLLGLILGARGRTFARILEFRGGGKRRRLRTAGRPAVAQRAADDRGAAGDGPGHPGRQHRQRCRRLGTHGAWGDRRVPGAAHDRQCLRRVCRAGVPLAVAARRGHGRLVPHGARADNGSRCNRRARRGHRRDHPRQRGRRGGRERDAAACGVRAVLRLRAEPHQRRGQGPRAGTHPGDRRHHDRDRALGAVDRAAGRVRAGAGGVRARRREDDRRAGRLHRHAVPDVHRSHRADVRGCARVWRRTVPPLRGRDPAGADHRREHAVPHSPRCR